MICEEKYRSDPKIEGFWGFVHQPRLKMGAFGEFRWFKEFKTDVSPNRQVMTEFMINDYGVHIDEDNFNVRFEQHPNSNIRISRNIHLRSGPQIPL